MSLRNPDLYHGKNKTKNFFEGWYFKISDESGEHVLAFIPGVSLGSSDEYSHSFLQIVNGTENKYDYLKYETNSFKCSEDKLDLEVHDNNFSLDGLSLNVVEENISISGSIEFNSVLKWPDTFLNPGSMGFYNYLTFMECYSQVCALDISLSGALNINGEDVSFENGKGYIEKNWGREFPYSWIWVQANNFEKKDASITCSIGRVPFLNTTFKGFLIGLSVGDQFYEFTTINRSKFKIVETDCGVNIDCENKNHILEIRVLTNKSTFITLNGPRDGDMIPLVDESLSGVVSVKLIAKKDNNVLFEGTSIAAGVEYGGKQRFMID